MCVRRANRKDLETEKLEIQPGPTQVGYPEKAIVGTLPIHEKGDSAYKPKSLFFAVYCSVLELPKA